MSTWHSLKEGQEVDVEITGLSSGGMGVGRVDGCMIFVKGGQMGEKLRVRVTNFSVRSAQAEIVKRLK